MRASRAICYLTFNGVYQNTNGIGRQTSTMVGTVSHHWDEVAQAFGPTAFSVITPSPYNEMIWGTDILWPDHVRSVARRTGGDLITLNVSGERFWSVATWRTLCEGAASAISELSSAFSEVLVLAVDVPFLHVGLECAKRPRACRIHVVHCPYSSYQLSKDMEPHPEREGWEADAFHRIPGVPTIHIGDVCRFMTSHLASTYSLSKSCFVPFESSLNLDSSDFQLDDDEAVGGVLSRYGVPRDRPLLLAFGRAHRIKGLDLLLESLQSFPDSSVHVVLVAVPYPGDDDYIAQLRALISGTGLGVTLLDRYDRELPRAVAQWHQTRVVCCPSRLDTLPNVPMEVALWASRRGPVVLASDVGGIPECVEDGRTGYLFRSGDVRALRTRLLSILREAPESHETMRGMAYRKVRRERDQRSNLLQLLSLVWSGGGLPC